MKDLDRLRREIEDAGHDGLRLFAEAVLKEAKGNIGVGDPAVDPAPLISLAQSGEIRPHGDGFVVSFSTVYAAKQHEDQRLEHPRGGGSKYLERAVTTLAPVAQEFVASKVRARIARGLRPGE